MKMFNPNSRAQSKPIDTDIMFSTVIFLQTLLSTTSDTAVDTVVNRLSLGRTIGLIVFMSTQA